MPYRTNDNQVNSAVITFINISEIKELETMLHKAQAAQQQRYEEQTGALEQSQLDLKTEQSRRL